MFLIIEFDCLKCFKTLFTDLDSLDMNGLERVHYFLTHLNAHQSAVYNEETAGFYRGCSLISISYFDMFWFYTTYNIHRISFVDPSTLFQWIMIFSKFNKHK